MTNNEIIKALECCADGTGKGIIRAILDLIKRQRAEIERLQSMNQAKLDMIHDIRAELGIARAEAIREFAKRLCEGRVSNDPVVIAVKVELEELTVNYESTKNDKQRKEDEGKWKKLQCGLKK